MKHIFIGILTAILLLSPFKGFSETLTPKRITEWSRTAAQGDAGAQFNLGLLHAKGQGVPKNYAEAFKWFHLAALQGNTQAQFYLGAMYANDLGVQKNYAEALKWVRLAALQEISKCTESTRTLMRTLIEKGIQKPEHP